MICEKSLLIFTGIHCVCLALYVYTEKKSNLIREILFDRHQEENILNISRGIHNSIFLLIKVFYILNLKILILFLLN